MKKEKIPEKTNVMRLLDAMKINYIPRYYLPAITDGALVADALGEPHEQVFKTLVTVSGTGDHFVFSIPVGCTLDLKKAAATAGVKSVAMIKQKDLLPLTGYIHGGCSPLGMKKPFATFFDITAQSLELFYVSAGRVGAQIGISPLILSQLCGARFAAITQ